MRSIKRQHRARIILAITLATSCLAAQAMTPGSCPAIAPQIVFDISEPTVDRTLGLSAIAAYVRDHRSAISQRSNVVMGFYESQPILSYTSSARSQPAVQPGWVAACIESLSINIRMRPSIRIARELIMGGCGSDAVGAHEYHHHEIQVAKMREAIPVYLANNPLPIIPFSAPTQDQAVALVNAYNKAYGQTMLDSLGNFASPAQSAFDSLAEYRRVSGLCPAEFGPLAEKQRRLQ